MQQVLALSKTSSFLLDEKEEKALQNLLDRLSCKKISWETFLQEVEDPFLVARMSSSSSGNSLLHLAVLDDKLDLIATLAKDAYLKERRNHCGLSSVELAQFLGKTEALKFLDPYLNSSCKIEYPSIDHFEYLSHPVFETAEGLQQVLANAVKAKKKDKIPAEKFWMGIYFDKEMRKGLHPPLSIRHVDDQIGWGVFAEKKILPCTFIGEYTGIIRQKSPRQLKDKRYCLRYPAWDGWKNFTIDAEEKGNFTRFINHSNTPNIEVQSVYWRGIFRMIFVSLKEIEEGAQITFDYGPLYWKNFKTFCDDL